jgi:hypothetical protein
MSLWVNACRLSTFCLRNSHHRPVDPFGSQTIRQYPSPHVSKRISNSSLLNLLILPVHTARRLSDLPSLLSGQPQLPPDLFPISMPTFPPPAAAIQGQNNNSLTAYNQLKLLDRGLTA